MRPSFVSIDLAALQHNYALAKQLSPSFALAVVKADAYGHGAVACANALAQQADGFAVSCVEEALQLRNAGIKQPIVLLEGFFDAEDLQQCHRQQLWPVIHAHWQLELLEQHAGNQALTCWLKLDSGMHRVGFFPHELEQACARLRNLPLVEVPVLMTHLARADEGQQNEPTAMQIGSATVLAHRLGLQLSLCNSAAVLDWQGMPSLWTRPGIMLYGANPMLDAHPLAAQLQPVMSFQSQIIAVRELPAGQAVGYGGRFVTREPCRIGVVAAGYADGYPRHAPDGTPVLVAGQRVALAGRVSMDMLTVDLSAAPQATVGSPVELWGKQLAADEIASHANTIAYCLFTGIKRTALAYS